jgi:hypothetical protein
LKSTALAAAAGICPGQPVTLTWHSTLRGAGFRQATEALRAFLAEHGPPAA